jgi:hypothetical protein
LLDICLGEKKRKKPSPYSTVSVDRTSRFLFIARRVRPCHILGAMRCRHCELGREKTSGAIPHERCSPVSGRWLRSSLITGGTSTSRCAAQMQPALNDLLGSPPLASRISFLSPVGQSRARQAPSQAWELVRASPLFRSPLLARRSSRPLPCSCCGPVPCVVADFTPSVSL